MNTQDGTIQVGDWLVETERVADILKAISSSLVILEGKRCTLEEKSIKSAFNALAAAYAETLRILHENIAQSLIPREELLQDLRDTNGLIAEEIGQFLKIARYDVNFLEQYFEYDFNTKMTSEYRFVDVVKRLNEELSRPSR